MNSIDLGKILTLDDLCNIMLGLKLKADGEGNKLLSNFLESHREIKKQYLAQLPKLSAEEISLLNDWALSPQYSSSCEAISLYMKRNQCSREDAQYEANEYLHRKDNFLQFGFSKYEDLLKTNQ